LKAYNIALLLGDGVGPELVRSARRVLEDIEKKLATFNLNINEYPFGENTYLDSGTAIPEETLAGIKNSHATLLGGISVEGIPSPTPVGFLRKELNLFADVRPVQSFQGAWSLKPNIDLVCIRENTEGFLADRNLHKGYGEFMPNEDQVLSFRVITRQACEKVARFAFLYARKNNRKKITVLHKANVLRYGCGFFLDIVREIGNEYPDIELTDEYIDIAANNLIVCPESYDILLTTNLFGDIISDEAAALVSSLVPTANIGKDNALFLPINHSPRYEMVKRGVVNPLAIIMCVGMIYEHLGEKKAAQLLRSAVEEGIREGLLTRESTVEVTEIICDKIRRDQGL
jgi:isocitrate/isopropylmalate dehydrogenase